MNLQAMQTHIASLPHHEQCELLDLIEKLEPGKKREASQHNFLSFVKAVWPAFIEGKHHKTMAEAFERVA